MKDRSFLFTFLIIFFLWIPANAESRFLPEKKEELFLSFSPVAEQVIPAVVNVYATRMVAGRDYGGLGGHPFFRDFFERYGLGVPQARVQASLGSGVLVSADGIVVTNNHVIADAVEIKIALSDRREFEAEVILKDKRTDLAILRIRDSANLSFPFLQLGDSDDLRVGDLVLAVGNPFGVGQTVTSGIISALARSGVGVADYQSFIQTDAAINPGNSGGALVDMKARLIGINTMIFSRSGGSQGIGFAIPSNMIRGVIKSATTGSPVRRPWLGAKLQDLTADLARALDISNPSGVLLSALVKGGPAERAGLKEGDIITAVAGRKVVDVDHFIYRFSTQGVGGQVELSYLRKGVELVSPVHLESAPESVPRDETVLEGRHPLAGATVLNLSPAVADELQVDTEKRGVIISSIKPDVLAAALGLLVGDIILQVNDKKIDSVQSLVHTLSDSERSWRLVIDRKGQRLSMFFGN